MAGVWSTSSQNFLDVGHTHEDVDGVLSLCKSAIDSAQCLQTPQDVMLRLRDKLRPVFDSRGIELDVEVVGAATCQASYFPIVENVCFVFLPCSFLQYGAMFNFA